jgi:uncharacterized protein YdiU (UPF0061 family)
MRRKLGLATDEEGDRALVDDLLDAMHRNQADFTLTFRGLCEAAEQREPRPAVFGAARDYDDWVQRWHARLARESTLPMERAETMRRINPAYIPRNHRIEQLIDAAIQQGDFGPFEEFMAVLSRPCRDQARFAAYANPPGPSERVLQTFCGT